MMLLFYLPHSNAQTGTGPWDLLSDLFGQLDDEGSQNLIDNLNGLGDETNGNLNGANEAFDGLFGILDEGMPAGVLDQSFIDVWGAGAGLLSGGLAGSGLDLNSQDTIWDAYQNIGGIFQSNQDSLNGAFGQYQDELSFDADNWNVVVIGGDDLAEDNFAYLQNNFEMNVNPEDPGNIGDIIGQLFSAELFPDLELAFGVQQADLSYWGMDYRADAKVIRVGSVPRFDQGTGFSQQFSIPVEARWHMQASWMSKENIRMQGDQNLIAAVDDFDGFSPLMFRADFAMMATPIVGTTGNLEFRFITSLGIEAGTYAPSHKAFAGGRTAGNQGFATGFGPQAGTGFSVKAGDLTMYSIATVAVGETLKSASPYKYNSRQIEAGIRYKDIINVRYSKGMSSWQPDANRQASVENQVTVGIILSELHF